MTELVSFVIDEEIYPYISSLLPYIESAEGMFQASYVDKDKKIVCRVSEGNLDEAYAKAFASVESLMALAAEKAITLPFFVAEAIIAGTTVIEGRVASYMEEKGYSPWAESSP